MRGWVLDTNVYIDAIRNEAARVRLADWQRRMAPFIHQHAVVVAELRVGRGIFNDCLLAASAREHGFDIITWNVRDFARIARVEPELRYAAPFPRADR